MAADGRLPRGGIAELWRAPSPPPDALARLLGRTGALVPAGLERPLSTTALAALIELSPAGTSRHLLPLRGAGLVSATRDATKSATAEPSSDPPYCAATIGRGPARG